MPLMPATRSILKQYRLGFGTMALTAIVLSGGTIQQSITHDVNPRAIVRYFTRHHYDGPWNPWDGDLSAQLGRLHANDLAPLTARETRMNPGGLVYTDHGRMTFYRIVPETAGTPADQHLADALFPRLLGAFLANDTPQFLGLLHDSGAEQQLRKPDDRETLGEGLNTVAGQQAARRILDSLTPYNGDQYALSLTDKLRFYERENPQGEYVGAWESLGFGESVDTAAGIEQAGHNRYIAIEHHPDRFVVRDFHDGEELRLSIPKDG